VLTAKDNVDHRQGWGTAQDQLAALSTNTRHIVANLDHMAFLEDPADLVVCADTVGHTPRYPRLVATRMPGTRRRHHDLAGAAPPGLRHPMIAG
jgi:hypothetical protein